MNDVTKQIARQARREAERATPAFSEALHGRVMRAVDAIDARSAEAEGGALPRRRTAFVIGLRHPWRVALAAAACVALVLSPVGLRLLELKGTKVAVTPPTVHPDPAPVVQADPFVLNRKARQVNERVKDVVETAMAEQQWAGLDQDVRVATRYLVDQVPFRSAFENGGREH